MVKEKFSNVTLSIAVRKNYFLSTKEHSNLALRKHIFIYSIKAFKRERKCTMSMRMRRRKKKEKSSLWHTQKNNNTKMFFSLLERERNLLGNKNKFLRIFLKIF
jgi:hypothetical protein